MPADAAEPGAGSTLRHVPNVLSAARILIALALPAMPMHWLPAAIALAGVTDLIDGQIARRFHVTSWLGGLLDGIADKLLALMALLTLVWHSDLGTAWALLLLSRDLAVTAIALYAAGTGQWQAFRIMNARLLGKLTTFVLFPTLVLLAFHVPEAWRAAVASPAAILSLAAAADYLRQFVLAHRKPIH